MLFRDCFDQFWLIEPSGYRLALDPARRDIRDPGDSEPRDGSHDSRSSSPESRRELAVETAG